MKIGFCVNNIQTEVVRYTTTDLALAATRLGHESWYISVGDLAYDQDEAIHARACRVAKPNHRTGAAYLKDLQGQGGDTRLYQCERTRCPAAAQ